MRLLKLEGLLLKTQAVGEGEKILSLFTPDQGVFRAYAKGGAYSLSKCEFIVKKSEKGVFRLSECHTLNSFSHLRASLDALMTVERMTHALLSFSDPFEAPPFLYTFFEETLHNFSSLPAKAVFASFQLKLMKAHGLFQIDPTCSTCKLAPSYRFSGMRFCEKHALSSSLSFNLKEEETTFSLLRASASELKGISLDGILASKINLLFEQSW